MLRALFGGLVSVIAFATVAVADDNAIIVQSTTSTANSGLYDYLLPLFEAQSDVQVRVVAVGTGQAIKNARNCDGDLLLVHAKAAEEAFVADGGGTRRTDLMYNDFVIVGPVDDPAGVANLENVTDALTRIAQGEALFLSRGDDSGTHKKEMSLWSDTAVNPQESSGTWYREMGSGMGATLNAAIGIGAYTMTDRATWISFKNQQNHQVLVEGDGALYNQYGVIPVNPAACPAVNHEGAVAFADWLISSEGQTAIAAFKLNGQQLFFPNAPQ